MRAKETQAPDRVGRGGALAPSAKLNLATLEDAALWRDPGATHYQGCERAHQSCATLALITELRVARAALDRVLHNAEEATGNGTGPWIVHERLVLDDVEAVLERVDDEDQ